MPEALAGKAIGLLTKPDKNSIEYKAIEGAAATRGISQARLMLEVGGRVTTHRRGKTVSGKSRITNRNASFAMIEKFVTDGVLSATS